MFVVYGCIILLSFAPFGAQICRSEDSLSSFDFLEDGACTAIVGLWGGTVAVVDRRTPGTSPELSADIGFKVTRTVDVHPVDKQYFLAAGSVYVAQNALLMSAVRGAVQSRSCAGDGSQCCWVVPAFLAPRKPVFSPRQHLK